MAVLLETVGELTASERFTPRSAGKSVNSLCANEESFFKKSWQKFSARYLFIHTGICECIICIINSPGFPTRLVNRLWKVFNKLSLNLRKAWWMGPHLRASFFSWDQLRWGADLSKLPCWDLFRFLYSDFHELRFCWLLDAITWLFIESLPAVSFDYLLTKWELLEFGCLKQTRKQSSASYIL